MENRLDWYITGDTHGRWDRLLFLKKLEDFSAAVIILGDFGANFTGTVKERSRKDTLNSFNNYIYAVRGNHDLRPEDVDSMEEIFDDNVNGYVYCQKRRWPNIRYLKDGGEYTINGHSVLVIGGAFSVDKDYRLTFGLTWIENELLTKEEMQDIFDNIKGKKYDFVLTHTCPYQFQPEDLFFKNVDQSKVDKSMEMWFSEVEKNIDYNVWLFGHFHDDRLIRPHVEMLYHDVCPLEDVYQRWQKPLAPHMLSWNFDPKYENKDCKWCSKKLTTNTQ